jgi:23S rRNA (uracil1939-C5)-methyltransferase
MSSGAPGTARKPARGDLLELELSEIDERGRTLGSFAEFGVAVRGGVLGARVRARVHKRRRRGIEAGLEAVLVPAPHGVDARCPHVASCGGCSFQELAYAAQLAAKERLLARVLAPLAPARIEPVLGCASPWNYRNKMDFTFGAARWIEPGEPAQAEANFALGLHARGHFQKVLDVRACEIAFAEAAPIVASVRAAARELGLAPWDVRARAGLLRHLVLRKSWASGAILADLVTTEAAPERIGPLAERVLARHAELTTLVQHVNPGVALVASGALARVFRGTGVIEERLDGLAFTISAHSFFQTNTPQAERMVRVVRALAAVRPGETVFDLYAGCGVFALALARDAAPENVVGFELAESSVADARANAARNGLAGVRFVAGDLALTLAPEQLALRGLVRPAVCIVDPPRAGLHARVLDSLRLLEPARLVYVSCNPRSAVQDVLGLAAAGYRLERVQPVDLFPHTPHLECVFALVRESAGSNGGSPPSPVGSE